MVQWFIGHGLATRRIWAPWNRTWAGFRRQHCLVSARSDADELLRFDRRPWRLEGAIATGGGFFGSRETVSDSDPWHEGQHNH